MWTLYNAARRTEASIERPESKRIQMGSRRTGSPPPAAPPAGTQSIQRASQLLREVAAGNRAGLRLVDLAERSGLEKPTVHRILQSLIAERLLMQSPRTRRYHLGQAVFEFGLAASQHFNLPDLCRPSLTRIAERTQDTAFLILRSGPDGVCVERIDGAFPIKVYSFNVSDRRPLGSGAGSLAILSALPADEVERIVEDNGARLKPYGGLTKEKLRSRVARTRELGYAHYEGVAGLEGYTAVGVAIRSAGGDAIASLSVSAISSRLTGPRLLQVVSLLRSEAAAVEKLLNGADASGRGD